MNLNQKDQPCQNFKPHDISPFSGRPTAHECFTCEGSRYFCANCHTDHHSDGWQPCWDARKAQEMVEAFKPFAQLTNAVMPKKLTEEQEIESFLDDVSTSNYIDARKL